MNQFVMEFPFIASPCDVITSTARLLDTGAEFAKFSMGQPDEVPLVLTWMTQYCVEFVDGNLNPFRGFPYADLLSYL